MIADISDSMSLNDDRSRNSLDSLNGITTFPGRTDLIRCPESVGRAVLLRIASEPARVVTDAQGLISEINPAFSALCGFTYGEVRGRKPGAMLQGPLTTPDTIDILRHGIHTRTRCSVDMVNYHKDQSTYRVHIELQPLFDKAGRLSGFEAREWKIA